MLTSQSLKTSFLHRPNLLHRGERGQHRDVAQPVVQVVLQVCESRLLRRDHRLRLALHSFGLRLLDALGEVLLDVSYLVLRVNA